MDSKSQNCSDECNVLTQRHLIPSTWERKKHSIVSKLPKELKNKPKINMSAVLHIYVQTNWAVQSIQESKTPEAKNKNMLTKEPLPLEEKNKLLTLCMPFDWLLTEQSEGFMSTLYDNKAMSPPPCSDLTVTFHFLLVCLPTIYQFYYFFSQFFD